MTTFLLHRHRRHHRPLSTRAAFSLDGFMSSFISGIGSFTTDTIFAVLRAICPASTIFAGWRQSVLPVHLLGLAPLLGSVGPVAGDVKLQDDGVVHDPVNRRGGGHGVGKDALPLREDQV